MFSHEGFPDPKSVDRWENRSESWDVFYRGAGPRHSPFSDLVQSLGRRSWDHTMSWISEQVLVGDDVYLYYAGYARGHKVNMVEERQIGLIKMKRDRYVAREAGAEEGRLKTRWLSFDANADGMTLNADALNG